MSDLAKRYAERGWRVVVENQRIAEDDDIWEEVNDVIESKKVDQALELTLALVNESPPEVLNYIAAGPLEDLLHLYGPQVVDRVLAEASSNHKMLIALHGVWGEDSMDPTVWKRLQSALRKWHRRQRLNR